MTTSNTQHIWSAPKKSNGKYFCNCANCGCYFFVNEGKWRVPHKPATVNEPPCRFKVTAPPLFTPGPAPGVTLENHFGLLVDTSGSMENVARSVGDLLAKMFKDYNNPPTGQDNKISCSTFDETTRAQCVAVPHTNGVNVLYPHHPSGGSTALIDGCCHLIDSMEANDDGKRANVFTVLTDGMENSSHRFTRQDLAFRISRLTATDRWTFVFMGPPGSRQTFRNLGVPDGNIREWEGTHVGVAAAAASASYANNNYYATRAAGATSTKSFFETDLSQVTSADLAKCRDVSHLVKGWTVDKETDIKSFVESHGHPFFLGATFYQLTKAETIQSTKQIMIAEKGSKKIYSGDEARALLKLPNYAVKVVPGNHAYFDVFVQSTSVNRRLVRGTRVIVRTDVYQHSTHTW